MAGRPDPAAAPWPRASRRMDARAAVEAAGCGAEADAPTTAGGGAPEPGPRREHVARQHQLARCAPVVEDVHLATPGSSGKQPSRLGGSRRVEESRGRCSADPAADRSSARSRAGASSRASARSAPPGSQALRPDSSSYRRPSGRLARAARARRTADRPRRAAREGAERQRTDRRPRGGRRRRAGTRRCAGRGAAGAVERGRSRIHARRAGPQAEQPAQVPGAVTDVAAEVEPPRQPPVPRRTPRARLGRRRCRRRARRAPRRAPARHASQRTDAATGRSTGARGRQRSRRALRVRPLADHLRPGTSWLNGFVR